MENHILISREVIGRKQADDLLFTIVDAEQQSLELVLRWAEQSSFPLSLEDCASEVSAFARSEAISVIAPSSLLAALFSIEGLRAGLGWTGDALIEYFTQASPPKEPRALSADEAGKLSDVLKRFFRLEEKFEYTRKAQSIYDGLLPTFRTCRSLVDVRPIFNSDASAIKGHIVAATLTVETFTLDSGNEEDELHSFQIDATDIDRLVAELTRLKSKISSISNTALPLGSLLNPKKSLVCQ